VPKAGAIHLRRRYRQKEQAIQALEMGAVARVSLWGTTDIWCGQTSDDRWFPVGRSAVSGLVAQQRRANFPWLHRLGRRPQCAGLAGLSEAQRVRAGSHALSKILEVDPVRMQQDLRGGFSHDWQADPFSRGAYSYCRSGRQPGGGDWARRWIATLFFAGEANAIRWPECERFPLARSQSRVALPGDLRS